MGKYLKFGIMAAVVIAVAAVVTAAMGGALSTSNVATEKVAGPGSLGLPAQDSVFQGGDTCATAVDLGSLPAEVSGTTIGYVDDYDEVCPYAGTAPDVVYSYTPATNMSITASLCTPGTATDYDTKLFIYENACPGTLTACEDDSCSAPMYANYVSEVAADLIAGNTYYFVVDGYGSNAGNYTLLVEEFIQQTCPCPPATDLDESLFDPDCGNDPTGGLDPNGGCNSDPTDPAFFTQIQCNTVICGTTSAFTTATGDSRDTDWFNLVLPGADTIRVTLTSEAPLFLFEIGPTDCNASPAVIQNFPQDNCSGTGEMVINGVTGNNWLFVGPQSFGAAAGVPCPTEYTLTVTCDTYPVELQSMTIE